MNCLASLLIDLGPHRGWVYALVMGVALLTGGLLFRRRAAEVALSRIERLGIAIGAFCGAMIGAKLPFLFSDWEAFLSGAAWMANGKTIVFGLVGGYFGVEIAKWVLQVRVKTGDAFAVPVAATVALGRLGCLTYGCCYGAPTSLPWGVRFPDIDGARHPTQLYEFVFHAVAAAALAWLDHRGLLKGQLIKLYILAYLAYRFLSEFIRPEPEIWGGLTGYQLAVLVLAPLFAHLWIRDGRLRRVDIAQVSKS